MANIFHKTNAFYFATTNDVFVVPAFFSPRLPLEAEHKGNFFFPNASP
jgi:hypothetical protein